MCFVKHPARVCRLGDGITVSACLAMTCLARERVKLSVVVDGLLFSLPALRQSWRLLMRRSWSDVRFCLWNFCRLGGSVAPDSTVPTRTPNPVVEIVEAPVPHCPYTSFAVEAPFRQPAEVLGLLTPFSPVTVIGFDRSLKSFENPNE